MAEIDHTALGQALDTTWGRSSTPRTASYSVKFKMLGPDLIEASYNAIVNFGTEKQMIVMRRLYSEESQQIINETIKRVKEIYKELTGHALKFKEESTTEGVEVINLNIHNLKRTAYFRRKTAFSVA